MKNKVFEGCATALVTPFTEYGIDYDSLCKIIEQQTEGGVSALVVAGTTGEASTLTEEEWRTLCRFSVSAAKGVKVIVGCGSNSTDAAVCRVRFAAEAGADAALVVTPYYNRATPDGLRRHYEAVCAASTIPVIAYNVPSRTGVDLNTATLDRIVDIPNLCGIKEATGSVSRSACLISRYKDKLPVYSGSDDVNFPILSIGGSGIISVASNVFPKQLSALCRMVSEGEVEGARELSANLYPFVSALFSEVNPIPVKTVMAYCGMCREIFRLPMCKISEEAGKALIEEYEKVCELI